MGVMRVLAVTPWFPSRRSPGSGVFNLRDVELLAEEHDVSVLHLIDPSLMDPDEPEESVVLDGVGVSRIPFATSRPALIGGAAREIRRRAAEADLLHTMAFSALMPATFARTGLPWVHTEHWSGLVTEAPTLRARLGGAVLRPLLARPDTVVAVGRTLADVIDRRRSDSTRVVGNRVNLSPPGELPEPPPAAGNAPLRLVAVGGLDARKGPLQTIEAVAALRSRGVQATVSWAGSGTLEREAGELARELGVADAVRLLGHVPPAELSRLLLDSHVFVLPTAGETFGVAIAEALGHGLPVVTTGVGGHRDFLPAAASRTPERSGAGIAEAIQSLVADQDRWDAARIRAFAEDRFSETARRDGYREAYRDAVLRHR